MFSCPILWNTRSLWKRSYKKSIKSISKYWIFFQRIDSVSWYYKYRKRCTHPQMRKGIPQTFICFFSSGSYKMLFNSQSMYPLWGFWAHIHKLASQFNMSCSSLRTIVDVYGWSRIYWNSYLYRCVDGFLTSLLQSFEVQHLL